jgi:hypothetical protein
MRLGKFLIVLAVTCYGSILGAAAPRTVYNFNPGWKVFVGDSAGAETVDFDDAAWKPFTLPYTWNEDDAFRKDIFTFKDITWQAGALRAVGYDERGKPVAVVRVKAGGQRRYAQANRQAQQGLPLAPDG